MKRKLILSEVLGSKIYFIEGDRGISEACLKSKSRIREETATQETIDVLKPGNVCIDIGANLGYYALAEAKIAGDKGFVYAIEPVKENIEALKKSIALNGYKNIKVFECAIHSKVGECILHQSARSNSGTMLPTHHPYEFIGDVKVKTLTLDAFVKQENITRVDFVRMDVEGVENEVVKGMRETAKLMPVGAILCIEIHVGIFVALKDKPKDPKDNFDMSKAYLLLDMLNSLSEYGFIPKSYARRMFPLRKVSNMEDLIKMLAEKYCPQVFFEMKKDWKKV